MMNPKAQQVAIAEANNWKEVSFRLTSYDELGLVKCLGTDPVNGFSNHMKDCNSKELNVGNRVSFMKPKYRSYSVGVIVRMTECLCFVQPSDGSRLLQIFGYKLHKLED